MFSINCKGRLFVFDKPKVMGIINTTPDSFYSGSRINETERILEKASQMISDGAEILDIGGQSTRPGSHTISPEEEKERIIPAIEAIVKAFPGTIISIDTYYADVAKAAVEAGANMVNDISAGSLDAELIDTVAQMQVPYMLMHMKGTPATMQQLANYDNVVTEVFDFLAKKITQLRAKGIKDIIADPGFGFAKQAEHNFRILSQLSYFKNLDVPITVGLSRKATVYKTLNTIPEEALNGTTVLHTIALLNGANILRVHDVKQAAEAIKLVEAYKEFA